MVAVPTSYNAVTEEELAAHGVNIVIYANQLMRAAYPAMRRTAEMILENERCAEAEAECLSIREILEMADIG